MHLYLIKQSLIFPTTSELQRSRLEEHEHGSAAEQIHELFHHIHVPATHIYSHQQMYPHPPTRPPSPLPYRTTLLLLPLPLYLPTLKLFAEPVQQLSNAAALLKSGRLAVVDPICVRTIPDYIRKYKECQDA